MTLMQKEIFEQPRALEECINFNRETLESLVKTLKEKNVSNVVVAARGTSDHAGIYGKYLIESLVGVPVGLSACSVVTLYGGKIDYKNMLVIGISQSGAAADVLAVLNQAKACGAVTVSVTNTLGSALADSADYHLYCDAGLESSVAATKTFGTQLYLMAHLACMWAGRQDLLEELKGVPALVQKVLDKNDEIARIAVRYRFMDECFILSRGINYPLALEATLKIQETNYVRAKAYPISDFHHGPFAMVSEGMPVFLYMSDGPAKADSMEMVKKLQGVGADLFVVSDDADLIKEGALGFQIPDCKGSDMLAAFAFAAFAQLFACNLTSVKGRNPDAPRGLKKITVTK